MVVPILFCFGMQFCLLAFYSKFVTTFPTDSAGRNLTYRFNPVSVVISCLHVDCYGWYDWFPGFLIVVTFNPLSGGGIHGFFEAFTILPTGCGGRSV